MSGESICSAQPSVVSARMACSVRGGSESCSTEGASVLGEYVDGALDHRGGVKGDAIRRLGVARIDPLFLHPGAGSVSRLARRSVKRAS